MTALLHLAMTGETDLTFTRQFAAPPRTLWRALTEPSLLMRWQWAQDWPMIRCDMDLRPGGSFRWLWQTSPERQVGVSGRFLTVEAPSRLIHTEVFDEDWTGGETTVTQTLEETAPKRTLLTTQVRYSSAAARQSAADSGMVPGMDEAYAKLDTLLPDLTP
jgi:uncharacterized protein YndB with AHSA1/START domain